MAEPAGAGGAGAGGGGWAEEKSSGDIQSLSFGGRKAPQGGAGGAGDDGSRSGDELFNDLLGAEASAPGEPVRVPAAVLKALRPSDVFIVRPGSRRNVQVRLIVARIRLASGSHAVAPRPRRLTLTPPWTRSR